ncbi:MAG: ATP-binding protein [Chlamydiae bacterium]|nr:ATP-binding protein [Chlamydiota bacterium]MBI3267216.1 ATP-binding protein [Chlamydiota bacterium]
MYTRLFKIQNIPHHQSFFLFGPRTTGKSTLIRNYLAAEQGPKIVHDLLKSDDFLKLQADPSLLRHEIEALLHEGQGPIQIHIDEIQKIPPLLDEVHSLLESYPGRIRFLLSGSSARKLKKGGANLLAGRAWQRSLYPLSFLEIGEHFSLLDALQFGTLPSLVDRTREEKMEQMKAYVMTYLREEIQSEALTRRLDAFHRFLESAAYSNGELINMTKMGQEAAVPRKTVASYYEILEDTLIGFFLSSWGHHHSRKELVTHGKFYFFDTGVVNTLTQNLSTELRPKTPLFGKFFEHFCILEFIRLHDYLRTEHRIGFFRTRSGVEVDLVQERGDKIRAIEIKATSTITKDQIRGLRSFSEEFPEAELIVVSNISQPIQLGKVRCLPWQDFFKNEWKMITLG